MCKTYLWESYPLTQLVCHGGLAPTRLRKALTVLCNPYPSAAEPNCGTHTRGFWKYSPQHLNKHLDLRNWLYLLEPSLSYFIWIALVWDLAHRIFLISQPQGGPKMFPRGARDERSPGSSFLLAVFHANICGHHLSLWASPILFLSWTIFWRNQRIEKF